MGWSPDSPPNLWSCTDSYYIVGGSNSRVPSELVLRPEVPGDRDPVALLAASSPICPLGLGCFPAPTTGAKLRLPRSGSRDKSCTASVCELPSGLGQLRPPTRDTGPSEPCQGPRSPCAPNTLCCGSSVAALRSSSAIQGSSSSKMIIQNRKTPKNNQKPSPEGLTNLKKKNLGWMDVDASAD